MEKIPTIFDRDWEGNRAVIDRHIIECDWVFKGEGIATEKVDGTNIKVRIENGKITKVWKRRNPNKEEKAKGIEPYYVEAHRDDPQDKHIFRAVDGNINIIEDGEYSCEAFGGKIQGNPLDVAPQLYFFAHSPQIYFDVPRDYNGLKIFLKNLKSNISPNYLAEGIVFHSSTSAIIGKMAKIKRKDFK